jgi:hypothetical protein
VINVKDSPYNAAGNGSSDDTSAIQDAIDDASGNVYDGDTAASAEDASAVVLRPKGTYLTTAPLKVPPTVTLVGEGPGTLIRSVFATEPPPPYDIWRGAIELTPDTNGYVRQAHHP